MTKYLLLSLLASTSLASATQFIYMDKDGMHPIQPAYVDKVLRENPADKIKEALCFMYVKAVKMDNGEYALHAHVRGLGGGPVTGACAYWGTKFAGWGATAVVLWVDPALVFELPLILEGIEGAATAAGLAGALAPLP